MAKRKGSNDAGRTRPGSYYDPGSQPAPRRKLTSDGALPGPVLNSRPHRRQRARLTFVQQFELAREMGFECPKKPADAIMHEYGWIRLWEAEYAKL